jgi:hypothetical protein
MATTKNDKQISSLLPTAAASFHYLHQKEAQQHMQLSKSDGIVEGWGREN